ncbi:MAG: hypothetical protein ACLFRP_05405 [Puniceicoccaceae bacterium]
MPASDRPSGNDAETGTESSPLSGYRFVPDRAFDLLSADEAEEPQEDEEAERPPSEPAGTEPGTAVPAAPPPTVVTGDVPDDFEELFPTVVEDTPPADAEAPPPAAGASLRSLLPPPEEPAPGDPAVLPPVEESGPGDPLPPPTVATDEPRPDESLPALTGPREAPPRSDEELTFPLTLEIPDIPDDERPPQTVPAGRTGTAATTSDRRGGTAPVFPVLHGSAPAAVGVGATLGDNSDIFVDALVPFWQTGDDAYRTILFLAPRITGTEEETNSGSLGLGIRSLRGEGALRGRSFPWIIGANVFYDFTRSSNDFDYSQFGAGLEWMSPLIDLVG